MATANTLPSAAGCPRCQKKGLPILLARFALGRNAAPQAAIAPPADYPKLPSACAHYTLRNMRAGYVYVFDSLDKQLTCYHITQGGMLTKTGTGIPITADTSVSDKHSPCMADTQRCSNAMLITVPEATTARSVWIGFSEHKWTARVCKQHIDQAATRSSHMTEVKVAGATPLSAPIANLSTAVSEFALDATPLTAAVGFAAYPYFSFKTKAESVVAEANRLHAKGLIVALHDPVALAADIAALMNEMNKIFMAAQAQPYETYATIQSIKASVDQSIATSMHDSDVEARTTVTSPDYMPEFRGMEFGTITKINKDDVHLTAAEIKNLQERIIEEQASTWKHYTRELSSPEALDNWHASFEKELTKYNAKFVDPLVTMHIALLKSDLMKHHMVGVFDNAGIVSGIDYVYSVMCMIGDTQTQPESIKFYVSELKGKPTESNYLLNAVLYNQKEAWNEVASKAASFDLKKDASEWVWSALIAGVAQHLDEKILAKQEVVHTFINKIKAPVSAVISAAVAGEKAANNLIVALGARYAKPIVRVELVGTKMDYIRFLTEEVLKASGKLVKEADVKRAVRAQLRSLELEGVIDLKTKVKTPVALMVDLNDLGKVNYNLSNSQRSTAMAASIKSTVEVEHLMLKDVLTHNAPTNVKAYALVGFGTLLQTLACYSLYKKMVKEGGVGSNANTLKFSAGLAAGVGGIFDAAERKLEIKINSATNAAEKKALVDMKKVARFGGKALLGGAAVIFAGFDLHDSAEAFGKGNNALGFLKFASALLGVVSTFAFFYGSSVLILGLSATGWGLIW